jgi:hypothetical protein
MRKTVLDISLDKTKCPKWKSWSENFIKTEKKLLEPVGNIVFLTLKNGAA